MSSNPNGQQDEWSSASQELFRAARSDHAPTAADRERVRRALAQRMSAGAGASSAGSMAGQAASTLSRVLKLGFGVSLVVVGTIAVKRAQVPSHAAPSSVVQPIAAAHSASPQQDSSAIAAPGGGDLPQRADGRAQSAEPLGAGAQTRGSADAAAQERGAESQRGVDSLARRDTDSAVQDRARASQRNGGSLARGSVASAWQERSPGSQRGLQMRGNEWQMRDASHARGDVGSRAARRLQARAALGPGEGAERVESSSIVAAVGGGEVTRNSSGDSGAHAAEEAAAAERQEAERVLPQPKAAVVQGQAEADRAAHARSHELSDKGAAAERAGQRSQDVGDSRLQAASRAPSSSEQEEAEASRAEDARAELVFVRKMQAALRAGDAEDVLELSAEHAQRWPHGTFVQEREGLRAIASCNTSAQSAEARAKAFLAKYPRTPLGPRVREACKLQLDASAAQSGAAR